MLCTPYTLFFLAEKAVMCPTTVDKITRDKNAMKGMSEQLHVKVSSRVGRMKEWLWCLVQRPS